MNGRRTSYEEQVAALNPEMALCDANGLISEKAQIRFRSYMPENYTRLRIGQRLQEGDFFLDLGDNHPHPVTGADWGRRITVADTLLFVRHNSISADCA